MWQRVQTLYLFLSTLFSGLLFFCDKAQVVSGTGSEAVSFLVYWPYLVLIVLITVLNLIALGSFKFRVFQMRTAILSALLSLALQIWLVVDYFSCSEGVRFHLTVLFPLAAIVFDILAARSIWADELMVRSASRLRSAKRKNH